MTWRGKLIGLVIGLMLTRNWFGAVVGMMLGHMWDVGRSTRQPATRGRSFVEPLFAFAGALSKSDGRVSEREIRATETLMTRLQLDEEQRRAAIERFNAGKQDGFEVHLAIAELKAWSSGRRDLAFLLLDLLLDLVYAEGTLAVAKLALVRKLCWALGVSERELAAIVAMKGYGPRYETPRGAHAPPPRQQDSVADPYAVLGVSRQATPKEIKFAYRKLMSEHHPDKLGDVPDQLKRRAEQRAGEINAAYDRLQTERGFR